MYKHVALITVLLLALCIMPAAVAYDTIAEYELPYTNAVGAWYRETILPANTTLFSDVTRIEWEGPCYMPFADGEGHGVISTEYTGTPVRGNATVIWSATHHTGYGAWCNLDIKIADFNPSGFTNPDQIFWVPDGDIGFGSLSLNNSQVAQPDLWNWSSDPHVTGLRVAAGSMAASGRYTLYSGEAISPAPPTANYTCNFDPEFPYANPPFGLVCEDTTEIYPELTSRGWLLTQPDGTIWATGGDTLTRSISQLGWYSLNFSICNALGCGYKNTTHLINITSGYIPATGISFWATTYDPTKSAVVKPSHINLQNLTSGFWRNISSTGGTVKFTATDSALTELITAGQTVKLCGYAPGYEETCYNATIPYSGWEYKINLASTSALPSGTNATLFVNAVSSKDATAIASATITVANTSIPYSKSVLSSAVGIATFVNIPAGTYTITATKTGYQSSTTSWPAPAGLVTNAYIGLQPIGATPVPTDTYGNPIYDTPIPTQTYAPGETQDTRTDEEKDADMMNLLRDQGPMLIQFFIVCFVIFMIMGIGRGR